MMSYRQEMFLHAFNAHFQPPVWDWINYGGAHSGQKETPGDYRIGLQSSFTVDFLQQVLEAKLRSYGLKNPQVFAGGFGQFRQELLNSKSDHYASKPNVTVLLTDPRELSLREIKEIVRVHSSDLPEGLLIVSNDFATDSHAPNANLNAHLKELAEKHTSVRILDMEGWVLKWGWQRVTDPKHEFLAGMLISPEMTPYLAEEILAFLYERLGLRKKCLVLDLDDTLWGGIVGEDGLSGIQLDVAPPGNVYRAVQQTALALRKKGALLAIASKNNPKDALEVIDRHSHMILRKEHFAAIEIGWDPKDQMLRRIAKTLNIGVDSLVFLDDNPNERELVRAMLPGVTVLDLPNDPAWWPRYLMGLRCFEASTLTAEDKKRAQMYVEDEKRKTLQKSAGTIEDYLKALETKVTIGYLKSEDDENLPRVAQLSQRTNQFNLNPTKRYTEGHLIPRKITPQTEDGNGFRRVFWMKVSDRLGDSGLVGGVVVNVVRDLIREPLVANIYNFFMSCRVIGRQVERAFIQEVLTYLKSKGVGKVRAVYVPGEKNMQTRDFYKTVGFQSNEERLENFKDAFGVELYDTQGVIEYVLSLENAAPEAVPYIRVEWQT